MINISNLYSGSTSRLQIFRLNCRKHLSGLNIRPATLKIRLLIISKLLTVSSNCGFRSSAMCSFNLKWNEYWRQYSWLSVYWTKRQWSTKPHWFLGDFSCIWWIADDMLVINVVEKYFWHGLKYLIPLKKFNLLCISYCTNYIHSLLQHLYW